jgi:hypothetical protein
MAATGEVERRFSRAGRYFAPVRIDAATRDLLRAENLEAQVGPINRFTAVADVVERFEANKHGAGAEDPLE